MSSIFRQPLGVMIGSFILFSTMVQYNTGRKGFPNFWRGKNVTEA